MASDSNGLRSALPLFVLETSTLSATQDNEVALGNYPYRHSYYRILSSKCRLRPSLSLELPLELPERRRSSGSFDSSRTTLTFDDILELSSTKQSTLQRL